MSFQTLKLLELVFILPVLYVISNDIMGTIAYICTKSGGGVFNLAITGIVMMLCVSAILRTWLKTLIIITMDDEEKSPTTTIIIIKKAKEDPKESTPAEDTAATQSPPETPPTMEKEGEIKSD